MAATGNELIQTGKDILSETLTEKPTNSKHLLGQVFGGFGVLSQIPSLYQQYQSGELGVLGFLGSAVSAVFDGLVGLVVGRGVGMALDHYDINLAEMGGELIDDIQEEMPDFSQKLNSIKADIAGIYQDTSRDLTAITEDLKGKIDLDGDGTVSKSEIASVVAKLAEEGIEVTVDAAQDAANQLPILAQQLKDKAAALTQ